MGGVGFGGVYQKTVTKTLLYFHKK